MAERTKAEKIEEFKSEIEAQIAAANQAISDSNVPALNEATVKLDKAEKDYMDLKSTIVYDELLTTEQPIVEAIKRLTFNILKHREVRKEGKLVALEIIERERQIDLLKFCEYAKMDTGWQYDVQKFNQLVCLRVAEDIGLKSEIKQICDSYYLAEQAKAIDMGGKPASNNALIKLLQQVIDGIVFIDDGSGRNKYKCNQHDVNFMRECYTKKGKKALGIACAKHDYLRRIVMVICHRIICDKKYGVEFKGDKNLNL